MIANASKRYSGSQAPAQIALVLVSLFLTLVGTISTAEASRHRARSSEAVISGEISLASIQRARNSNGVIRVTGSPGGSGVAAMELARHPGVVIDGTCNSACAWAFVTNDRACFTRNASFGFHASHDPGTGRPMIQATDYWLSKIGSPLRSRLDGLRSSSSLIVVGASEMQRYYGDRACNGRRTAQSDRH